MKQMRGETRQLRRPLPAQPAPDVSREFRGVRIAYSLCTEVGDRTEVCGIRSRGRVSSAERRSSGSDHAEPSPPALNPSHSSPSPLSCLPLTLRAQTSAFGSRYASAASQVSRSLLFRFPWRISGGGREGRAVGWRRAPVNCPALALTLHYSLRLQHTIRYCSPFSSITHQTGLDTQQGRQSPDLPAHGSPLTRSGVHSGLQPAFNHRSKLSQDRQWPIAISSSRSVCSECCCSSQGHSC